MQSMFVDGDRVAIETRLTLLQPDAARQWGRMSAAQMLAHCAAALETPLGERRERQSLLGRVMSPFIRSSVFGQAPFRRNTPTDAQCIIADQREFAEEQRRLLEKIRRFCDRGPSAADQRVHSFFGSLTGPEWGRFVYKHLDHHLRQFGS